VTVHWQSASRSGRTAEYDIRFDGGEDNMATAVAFAASGATGLTWTALDAWLESHEKLSGWAQTLGALLALFVAVGVPLWQQARERSARERERTALAHTLSLALRSLLNDLSTAFAGLLQLAYMPRSRYHHDPILEDCLQRIRAQEERATTPEAMTLLYTARGTLQIVRRALDMGGSEDPLTPSEQTMISGSLERIGDALREANVLVSDHEYAFAVARTRFFGRVVAWFMMKTGTGRRFREHLVSRMVARHEARIARGW